MKLGGKTKDVDSFVDQLKNEGEKISNLTPASANTANPVVKQKLTSTIPTEM